MKMKFWKGPAAAALVLLVVLTGCPTSEDDPPAPKEFTVSFDAGDGGGTAPAEKKAKEGEEITLPGQGSLTPPAGKAFDGWKGGGTTVASGGTYKVTKDITFIAQWKTTGVEPPPPPVNPLLGSWASPSGDDVQDLVIFTANRVYFSKTVIKVPRQGYLDTGASTIKLRGVGNGDITYDYSLEGSNLTVKKVINGTDDITLKRRDGSTSTGLEDTWISTSLSSTQPTLLIIIEAADKGNSILYNFDYDKWWKTDTYTYDQQNKELRWNNWSTTPTKYTLLENGDLKIKFPTLSSYNGDEITFKKTTYF